VRFICGGDGGGGAWWRCWRWLLPQAWRLFRWVLPVHN